MMFCATANADTGGALWKNWAFASLCLSLLGCPTPSQPEIEGQAEAKAKSASAQVATKNRPPTVLLIGIDGADLRWIDRLSATGRLPAFDNLMNRGVTGSLETVHYASPIIWTSVATGVVPVRHGIGSFLANVKPDGSLYSSNTLSQPETPSSRLDPRVPKTQVLLPSGRERPATVADRKRPAFWNIISHYKRSVGVLAWWATYPAEQVNGYMISPYLLFQIPNSPGTANVEVDWTKEDTAKAFPSELGNEVGPMMYRASKINVEQFKNVLGSNGQTPYSHWVLARDRSYYEAALHTLNTRPVDCVAVYFQGPDIASHDFTSFVFGRNINKSRKPRVSEAARAKALIRVEAMYERMDELLGGLLEKVGPETNVIIVSDHGWEYDGTSHWNLNAGVFIGAGPGFRESQRVDGISVVDITPLVLSLLQIPVARAFDGKIPDGVLVPEVEIGIRYVDDYPIPAVSLVAESAGSVPEDENMMKLLRGLGYIE